MRFRVEILSCTQGCKGRTYSLITDANGSGYSISGTQCGGPYNVVETLLFDVPMKELRAATAAQRKREGGKR